MRIFGWKLSRLAAAVLATGLVLLATSGGLSNAWAQEAPTPRKTYVGDFHIVASFVPIKILVDEVAADIDGVKTSMLLPGALGCPHDTALSPSDLKLVATANVLVINGAGMEPFMDKIRENVEDVPAIEVTDGVPLIASDEVAADGRRLPNPHAWVSPQRFGRMALTLAEELARIDPTHADAYKENAKAAKARWDKLAAEFVKATGTAPNRKLVATHTDFTYLIQDASAKQVAVIFEHGEEPPSAKHLAELTAKIKAERPLAILAEPQFPDKLPHALSKETGVPVVELDTLATGIGEYGEYDRVMAKNLETWRRLFADP